MAPAKWLLLLFFCWPQRLVPADELSNRIVEDVAKENMNTHLGSCYVFFERQYKKCLPDNYTDVGDLSDIAKILEDRRDTHCYYALFDNSSVMFEKRSVRANETSETLRLGWELSRDLASGMYCEDASCEWSFLGYVGSYFKSLDAYLTSVIGGLLTAIADASEKLARGEATAYYENVCTPDNLTVMACEFLAQTENYIPVQGGQGAAYRLPAIASPIWHAHFERIGGMFGGNCSKPKRLVFPRQCSDRPELDWPVEPNINAWNPKCYWPRLTAQGLCGGARQDDVPSEDLLMTIYEAGVEAKDRAKELYLPTGGPKVIDEVANDFEKLAWPGSEEDAEKYKQLKRKIEEAFKPDYGEYDREYLIFYPCKDEAFAVLKDVSTENTLIHVRRPDVNVIVRRISWRTAACDLTKMKNETEGNKDSIVNAYKNAKGNSASYRLQQVDKLFKWRVSGYSDFGDQSVKVRSESSHVPMCADIVFIM